jgi:putative FmdB family regulatory protein
MPFYEYQVREGHEGCDTCRHGFEKWQKMKDDSLTACPDCGAPIQRLLFAQSIATPKTPSELKNLGFTKLVKREEGVYENVTRTGDEAKFMLRDKPETVPDIKRKISD